MKHNLLRNFTPLAVTAVAAFGLMLTSGVAFAQTTKAIKGDYHSSDGNSGTYVETITINGNTKTDDVISTRNSDKKTSTDNTSTTVNPDKSRTITHSETAYGATAEFTSQRTVDKVKGGFSGTGTYTTAAGVSGTLTSLETSAGTDGVRTIAYTASTGGVTTDLRVEYDGFGFALVKTFSLAPDGTTTANVTTHYITSQD